MLRRSTYTVAKAALRINPPNGEVGVRTYENRAIILGIKAEKPLETPAVFGLQSFRPHVLVGDGGFPPPSQKHQPSRLVFWFGSFELNVYFGLGFVAVKTKKS